MSRACGRTTAPRFRTSRSVGASARCNASSHRDPHSAFSRCMLPSTTRSMSSVTSSPAERSASLGPRRWRNGERRPRPRERPSEFRMFRARHPVPVTTPLLTVPGAGAVTGWCACAMARTFLYSSQRTLVAGGFHGKKRGGGPPLDLRDRIVDAAVELAEEVGWENLRLRKVADRLGVPLTTVLEIFRDIDAVTHAWFARALTSMLRPPERGFEALSSRERPPAVLT